MGRGRGKFSGRKKYSHSFLVVEGGERGGSLYFFLHREGQFLFSFLAESRKRRKGCVDKPPAVFPKGGKKGLLSCLKKKKNLLTQKMIVKRKKTKEALSEGRRRQEGENGGLPTSV